MKPEKNVKKIKLKIILLIVIFLVFFSNKIFARYYEKIEYIEVKGIITGTVINNGVAQENEITKPNG